MRYAVWDQSNDRYHPIDMNGESTLCNSISAWGTRIEGFNGQGKYSGDLKVVVLSHSDYEGKLCGNCTPRIDTPVCPESGHVLQEKQAGWLRNDLYCHSCKQTYSQDEAITHTIEE